MLAVGILLVALEAGAHYLRREALLVLPPAREGLIGAPLISDDATLSNETVLSAAHMSRCRRRISIDYVKLRTECPCFETAYCPCQFLRLIRVALDNLSHSQRPINLAACRDPCVVHHYCCSLQPAESPCPQLLSARLGTVAAPRCLAHRHTTAPPCPSSGTAPCTFAPFSLVRFPTPRNCLNEITPQLPKLRTGSFSWTPGGACRAS